MNLEEAIAYVKAEREQVEEAIRSLELLAHGIRRKRGRPPAWMATVTVPKRYGGPPGSTNPDPPLPPGAAMHVPRPLKGLVWAVSGKMRPAS
jgi:hypothetical protein